MKKLIGTLALGLVLAPTAAAWATGSDGMAMGQGMTMTAAPAVVSPTAAVKAKPAKKVKKAKSKAKKAEAAAIWTCPMHPEVHEHHAGRCPKCGMDLVKEEAPAKK